MRRKIKLRKKVFHSKKMKKANLLLIITILIIISIIFVFKIINLKVTPILTNYAEIEMRKLATIVIGDAVTTELSKELDTESLFIINKNNDSNIETIDFNTVIVNKVLIAATTSIQINLKYLESGQIDKLTIGKDALSSYDEESLREGIVYSVPMGAVFNNSFLANLGPKIPIRFNLVGEIKANLKSTITDYGINSALIETVMHLTLNINVILPIAAKEISIESNVPISMKIISGEVPKYYLNGYNQTSSILTLPVE